MIDNKTCIIGSCKSIFIINIMIKIWKETVKKSLKNYEDFMLLVAMV
jgi:hypothetical protein